MERANTFATTKQSAYAHQNNQRPAGAGHYRRYSPQFVTKNEIVEYKRMPPGNHQRSITTMKEQYGTEYTKYTYVSTNENKTVQRDITPTGSNRGHGRQYSNHVGQNIVYKRTYTPLLENYTDYPGKSYNRHSADFNHIEDQARQVDQRRV